MMVTSKKLYNISPCLMHQSTARKNISSMRRFRVSRTFSFCVSSHALTIPSVSVSSSDKKIIPIRDIVAGDANVRSFVSNKKFTF